MNICFDILFIFTDSYFDTTGFNTMVNKIYVAIFVRVSTKQQDTQRQVDDLKKLCEKQGWKVVSVITETVSGKTKNSQRPGLKKLMEIAETGLIQKVVVSEVSRLGRNTREVLEIIDELSKRKISLYIQNHNLETLTPTGKVNSMAKFMLTLLAEFARMERETLIERTISGQKRAWEVEGKQKGRPIGTIENTTKLLNKYPEVVRHLNAAKSLRDVAARCGVAINTVRKVKKAMGQS